ncbi:MAG TPA: N-acetylmuramoyl-L-alanine amidase [Spirochaetota bacterium]|nr:N-acetylmuramoyl-L-alanine amidase [Spirochaetota bacterium]
MTAVLSFFIFIGAYAYSAPEQQSQNQQPQSIVNILNSEKNAAHREKINEIVNRIDNTYGRLYENLQQGKKIVIFFDPAHGKLPNGMWQGGDATRRTSCTGLPEEYYSILLSRKMYELLSRNRHIEVKTTDDYMAVLKGNSDTYNDISFTRTVELAEKAGAFIIISEHLNNISVLYKADGRVNLPGIHVTRNGNGWKVLQVVRDTYDGFLTLYNRVDASGFCPNYAQRLKKMHIAKGLKPNSWNFGAVGDTRFSYFIDFPMSVIYESGFVSNPDEEKKLRDPEYISMIVENQYNALIEQIKETFSVDISGSTVQKTGETSPERIELLKLARLAIYYIQAVDSGKAIRVIREMEKKYSGTRYADNTAFFSSVKMNLVNSSRYYQLAAKYKRQKKNKLARKHFWMARRYLLRAPFFAKMREHYRTEFDAAKFPSEGKSKPASAIEISPVKNYSFSPYIAKSPMQRSIIFPIERNQSIEKAIELALSPDPETMKKLVKSFRNAHNISKVKTIDYITKNKKKKRVVRWKEIAHNVKFAAGIYIVRLDKNCNVVSAQYVNSVALNPNMYQNQQYLKNSYFANETRERSL